MFTIECYCSLFLLLPITVDLFFSGWVAHRDASAYPGVESKANFWCGWEWGLVGFVVVADATVSGE